MATARDHYRKYFAERLWDWVPAVYHELDAVQGGDSFRALLKAIGSQSAVAKRSQDRLWDDMFVELSDDWAVPYIAQLVATRLVSALNPRARRADVAKTIYFRRRNGTRAPSSSTAAARRARTSANATAWSSTCSNRT